MTNKNKEIGLRIKKLRLTKGYSQDELAGLLSFSQATVSYFESGLIDKLEWEKIQELADVLEVDGSYIMNGTATESRQCCIRQKTLCEKVSLWFKKLFGGK